MKPREIPVCESCSEPVEDCCQCGEELDENFIVVCLLQDRMRHYCDPTCLLEKLEATETGVYIKTVVPTKPEDN